MLSPELVGVLGIIVLFLGLSMGFHIGVTLAGVGFLGFVALMGFHKSLGMLTTTPYYTVADYSFIVLPLFLLMGEFAFQGGIGQLLYKAAAKWLGRIYGGLAMATTASAALFSSLTGSSLATAATFSKLAVPEMMALNFDKKLACGVVAASGSLAALIPPSGLMVLFSVFTEVSLGKLFIAGIFPGILSAMIYICMIYFRVRMDPSSGPRTTDIASFKEKVLILRWLAPVGIVVVVMLGGIYGGIFSPIEAGAVGAFTVFIVVVARRSLSLAAMKTSLMNAARTSAMIFFLVIGSIIFGKFLVISGLPDTLLTFVKDLAVPRIFILVSVLLLYTVLGTFLDVVAMLAITLPTFFPLLHGLGFDGIWIGILTIKMIEIAAITPPIGLNVYVVKGVVGDVINLRDLFQGILPFFAMDVLTLAILVAFPQISLWLPSKMF